MSTSAAQGNGASPPSGERKGRTPPGDGLARFLGGLSLALGLPQIAMPHRVNELIGVRPTARSDGAQRGVGVREIMAAAGILTQRRPAGWLWARVGGDAVDLALLGIAARGKANDRRRIGMAAASVAGVFALDLAASLRHSRGAKHAEHPDPGHVTAAITVWKPREEVYAYWRDFARLPSFMAHLASVQPGGDGRSHWTAKAPAGTVEWDAELVEDRPNELIAWRSTPGAQIENAGTVRFRPAPRNWGTEILLDLRYAPPGGAPGKAVAKLLGEEPQQQVEDDLRRFKQVIETGEVVRSDGSPEGVKAIRQSKQRPAQPMPAGAGAQSEGSAS